MKSTPVSEPYRTQPQLSQVFSCHVICNLIPARLQATQLDSFDAPCSASSANPNQLDCSIPDISSLQNGFPANSLSDPNTPFLYSLDPKLVTPYMQQWHLSIERELPADSVFEITYAGSKGNKLFVFLNGNQAAPTPDTTADLAPRRPVPLIDNGIDWFRAIGASSYNSLQMHYEKRFTYGLQFQASYTWAHSIDNVSNANLGPTQNNSDFRYFRDPEAEFGNSDFGMPHRFVASYIYELPFGRGKKFMGQASGFANQLIGGWQIAGITSISSGSWLDSNGNFSNSDGGVGGVSQRPDYGATPGCVPATGKLVFFNTCLDHDPALGSFGNVGRNTLQGPGYQIWDFTLGKHFPVTAFQAGVSRGLLQHLQPSEFSGGHLRAAEFEQQYRARNAAIRFPDRGSRSPAGAARIEAEFLRPALER